jgi:predicted ester cyclase
MLEQNETESNKAIVRRFYEEVMNNGRVNVLAEIMAPDFSDNGETLFGSPQGREALGQGVVGVHDILQNLNVYIEDMIADGEMVGVRGVMRCIHNGPFLGVPGTGNELSWRGLAMFRVVNGKIVARWFNSDSLSIVQQMGIVPLLPSSPGSKPILT